MTDRTGVLEPLEGKSASLFLVAGGLLAVFAANTGSRVFADAGLPAVHSVFGPAGFFVGILGLLGLCPALAGRTSTTARAAGVVAVIPAVGWFVITAFGVGNALGVLPGLSVVVPPAFPVVVFLTTFLAYVLFGATALRARVHSLSVGLLLLVPALVFLTLIVAAMTMPAAEWMEFVLDSGHALGHLAIGGALRSDGVPTERRGPTPDSPA